MKTKKIYLFFATIALLITTAFNSSIKIVTAENEIDSFVTILKSIDEEENKIFLEIQVTHDDTKYLNTLLPNGEIISDGFIEYSILTNGNYIFSINYTYENIEYIKEEVVEINYFIENKDIPVVETQLPIVDEYPQTIETNIEENDDLGAVKDSNEASTFSVTLNDSAFEIDLNSNSITGYDVSVGGTEVIIPESINGVPVYHIAPDAFYQVEITSLVIPEGVISIGDYAFSETLLTTVSIPSSITTFGEHAFSYSLISNLQLSDGLTVIGDASFDHNELSELTLPSSLKVIPDNAFENNYIKHLIIPEGIEEIQFNAFQENLIETLELPSTLKLIGEKAFQDNWLKTVNIPSSVKIIGAKAFDYNELEEVIFNEGLEEIHDFASRDNYLTHLEIPFSVTNLGENIIESQFVTLEYYNLSNQKIIDLKGQFPNLDLSKIHDVELYQNNTLITFTYDSTRGLVTTTEDMDNNTRLKYEYVVTNGTVTSLGKNSVDAELVEVTTPTPTPTPTPSSTQVPNSTFFPENNFLVLLPNSNNRINQRTNLDANDSANIDLNNKNENTKVETSEQKNNKKILGEIKINEKFDGDITAITKEYLNENVNIYDDSGKYINFEILSYEITSNKIVLIIQIDNLQTEKVEIAISELSSATVKGDNGVYWLIISGCILLVLSALWLISKRNKGREKLD